MKIFLDTASIEQIREGVALGLVDGVTTNPTLISREQGDFEDIIVQICELVDGPVSAEVVSLECDGMLKEAKKLAALHENVVIKIPMIKEGVKALHQLSDLGIRTNCTLVFSSNQALLAAKAGASFVSPFIGRLDDAGHCGMDVVREIMDIYENYAYETEVIVASVRHPLHVVEAAMEGADITTMPYAVFDKLFKHPFTDKGLESFLADWEKVKNR
ncbi:MAG: fructose-6-phosphate aldolase [Candidatus Eisenbacteria bacterium]|nr:fructose-6-phosphate aldolase [Candidatus Eisenbacteria bacterium]